jgi:outer membrane protein assembly factor BamB
MPVSIYRTVLCLTVLVSAPACRHHPPAEAGPQSPVPIWTYEFKSRTTFNSPALAGDGTVYVGTEVGLYAIAPGGLIKWKTNYEHVSSSPAIAADGTIYFTTLSGSLCAYNANQTRVWPYCAPTRVSIFHNTPAIDGDQVYAPGYGLQAISGKDGHSQWTLESPLGEWASPIVGPTGLIFFGGGNGAFYAASADGEMRWSFPLRAARNATSAAVDSNDVVYFGADNGKVYALYDGGESKWEFQTSGELKGGPALGEDGTVYIGGHEFYAITAAGAERWKLPIRLIYSTPAIAADGTIYVTGDKLYAITPGGQIKWRLDDGAGFANSPNIGPDGTVYALSRDGKLYAIPQENGGLAPSPWPKFQCDPGNSGRAPMT